MAKTEVLLLESIPHLGDEGDFVTVAAGFARNYLLTQQKAIPVNRANQRYVDSLKRLRHQRETHLLAQATALVEQLKSLTLVLSVRAGESGRMFGSVTNTDLLEELAKRGIQLPSKSLYLGQHIKTLGQHKAHIKLHPQVSYELPFEVVAVEVQGN